MNLVSRPWLCLAAVGLIVGLAGCGGTRLHPVEGVVQYDDGRPARDLAGGTVSLESVADQSNAAGEIRADGTFRVRSPLGKDGVPIGSYRLLVLPPEGADRRNPPVDHRFGRYETSGIEVTVKEGDIRVSVVVSRPGGGKKK